MGLADLFTRYSGSSLELVVWSLFIGIVVAAGITFYNKRILGGFIRELVEKNAVTPESAMTLGEVGYTKNVFLRMSLRKKSMLRKIVYAADNADDGTEKKNVDNLRFYVPAELEERVALQYGGTGTTVMSFILTVLAFVVVAVLSLILIPILTDLFSGFIDGIEGMFN